MRIINQIQHILVCLLYQSTNPIYLINYIRYVYIIILDGYEVYVLFLSSILNLKQRRETFYHDNPCQHCNIAKEITINIGIFFREIVSDETTSHQIKLVAIFLFVILFERVVWISISPTCICILPSNFSCSCGSIFSAIRLVNFQTHIVKIWLMGLLTFKCRHK